eukprot:170295-Amphidinium_carterae.1
MILGVALPLALLLGSKLRHETAADAWQVASFVAFLGGAELGRLLMAPFFGSCGSVPCPSEERNRRI